MRISPRLTGTQHFRPLPAPTPTPENIPLSHWRRQILELQRDFGPLLRQAAIFERVGELVVSPIAISNCDCITGASGSRPTCFPTSKSAVKFTAP